MQHTHSPALLRAAINGIISNSIPASSLSNSNNDQEELNTVISFPPSPNSIPIELDDSLRPLDLISPLDGNLINFLPLSTPPISRSSSTIGLNSKLIGEEMEIKGEEDYPLILVTGGSGFIGSHTTLEILQEGLYGVIVIDNLINSYSSVLHRVKLLSKQFHDENGLKENLHPPLYFHNLDITDESALEEVFKLYSTITPNSNGNTTTIQSRIVSSIHFAALKSVSQSLLSPLEYYKINVTGTLNLLTLLSKYNIKKIVLSSSCVIYGAELGTNGESIKESDCEISKGGGGNGITNPYGRTKRMCEEILYDLCQSDEDWYCCSLRYTNPSGAHPSGYIGEDPTNAVNLLPVVTHVLQGKREFVTIHGADYSTPDGTGVRDFIHVLDLAQAHLAALRAMNRISTSSTSTSTSSPQMSKCSTYNISSNSPSSVLTVIETLSLISQRSIKIKIGPRRKGDLGTVICDSEKAERELGWKAKRGLVEMCRDLVNWQAMNPMGYSSTVPSSTSTAAAAKPAISKETLKQ